MAQETCVEAQAQAQPQVYTPKYTQEELWMVANTIEGEARGVSAQEMRLVAWCICNRVDNGAWGSTIKEVVTPGQFHGYNPNREVSHSLYMEVAQDVLDEWSVGNNPDIMEPFAPTDGYVYFSGDGKHNWFREEY